MLLVLTKHLLDMSNDSILKIIVVLFNNNQKITLTDVFTILYNSYSKRRNFFIRVYVDTKTMLLCTIIPIMLSYKFRYLLLLL